MGNTVRMKAQKKQPAFALPASDAEQTRRLEQAVMELEDAVYHVLDMNKGHSFHDVDFLYWNRRLKNIATQVSMALNECRGPRRFHQHYRHDPKHYETLYPVSGPAPLNTLARVCREALTECVEMIGVYEPTIRAGRERLELALRAFLKRYQFRGATN